jgi:C-terminal processing protease CtpA/Prc
VVKEEGREAAQSVVSATGPALWHAPLTVLVDGDTASAAEILAGKMPSLHI